MKLKYLTCSIVLLLLLFTVGCMTEQQVGEIRTFSKKVDGYQAVVNELKEAFVEDKVITESLAGKMDKVNEWLDESQPTLENIAVAVENAPKNVVSQMKAGAEQAGPLIPAPYNAAIIGVLGLLEAFTVKKVLDKNNALTKESGKRRSEKAGTRKTINELATLPVESITAGVVESKLFDNIGSERARNGFT